MVQRSTLGVILSAGKSSRLYPATLATTKQLLPVYDKPLIYYPLTTLMLAGVQDVLVITSRDEQTIFQRLLGTGSELGMHFDYIIQDKPEGIAQSLTLANDYLAAFADAGPLGDGFDNSKYNSVFLILGDNLFYGSGLSGTFGSAVSNCVNHQRAQTFFQKVKDPSRFGVGEFGPAGDLIGIEEKPQHPKSEFACVGAYLYPMNTPNDGLTYAGKLNPSARGELEITDLNQVYIKEGKMNGYILPRGTSWFDCGTYDSLLEAAQYVKAVQEHQGYLVGSPHEIAFNRGWIDVDGVRAFMDKTGGRTKNAYNEYLYNMVTSGRSPTQ
jgi:glucose-1-phosphate thymidylyltransferase